MNNESTFLRNACSRAHVCTALCFAAVDFFSVREEITRVKISHKMSIDINIHRVRSTGFRY